MSHNHDLRIGSPVCLVNMAHSAGLAFLCVVVLGQGVSSLAISAHSNSALLTDATRCHVGLNFLLGSQGRQPHI